MTPAALGVPEWGAIPPGWESGAEPGEFIERSTTVEGGSFRARLRCVWKIIPAMGKLSLQRSEI
jgi:hypothetical protein